MALNSISFQGYVHRGCDVKPMSKENMDKIKDYAQKYSVDVDVLKETSYADGEKKYTAAVFPEGGDGAGFIKVFNMRYPNDSKLYTKDMSEPIDEVPEYLDEADEVSEEDVF